jgi:hypothetical protein
LVLLVVLLLALELPLCSPGSGGVYAQKRRVLLLLPLGLLPLLLLKLRQPTLLVLQERCRGGLRLGWACSGASWGMDWWLRCLGSVVCVVGAVLVVLPL